MGTFRGLSYSFVRHTVRESELNPCTACERNAVAIQGATICLRPHDGIDHHPNAFRSGTLSNNHRLATE